MYNLRYHIASLVAVFLSLAVGLLLGTVVVERGVLDRQKTTLVDSLTSDFEQMRSTNDDMRAKLDRTSSFAEQAVGPLARGTLDGRVVLIVSDPTRGETLSRVAETVRQAGATPVTATFRDEGFGLGDTDLNSKVVAVVGPPTDAEDLQKTVAETLAREFGLPEESRPLLKVLVDAGELALEGSTSTMTVSAAVLTGSFEDKADPAQVSLAASFQALGSPAVGVESTKRATGVAAACDAAGCSAVDNVDEPLGRISLVWVLSGRTSGYFGVGKGVDAAFPTPLFPGS